LLATVTAHHYEVAEIVRVDEQAGLLYYTARSGDNPMKLQLHRVSLDGHGDRRLTDPAFHHNVDLAPDGQHFVDVAQTHDTPPVTVLRDAEGRLVAELARSDLRRFKELRLKPVELLQFKAADGDTDLYGMLHFPSDFRPRRKYPLLVSVYAGPATTGARETFTLPNALTEMGFLVATFDSRSASGRGKQFLDAIYLRLGIVEVDDQAAAVKALWRRHYVDKRRVGMFGTSYGGTVSATCLLRYPEVFQAACANSAVTDYRNYDTIYAERYMWMPQENKAGYEAASVMSYATNLQGRLMLFYGTADNNVHPANALQLIQALQQAGKSFEVQVGPDQGHAAVNRDRMMEFFIQSLVLAKPQAPHKQVSSKGAAAKAQPVKPSFSGQAAGFGRQAA
jgi:dipeptidyl-peptidase-4